MQELFFIHPSKFALVCLAMWKRSVWQCMWHCMCLRWAVPWAVGGSAVVGEGESDPEKPVLTNTLTDISSWLQEQRCSWEQIAGECTTHTWDMHVYWHLGSAPYWNGNLSLYSGWALCETLSAWVSECVRGMPGRCTFRYTWARQSLQQQVLFVASFREQDSIILNWHRLELLRSCTQMDLSFYIYAAVLMAQTDASGIVEMVRNWKRLGKASVQHLVNVIFCMFTMCVLDTKCPAEFF